MKFFNFLIMNVLFLFNVSIIKQDDKQLISASENVEITDYRQISDKLVLDEENKIIIGDNEFNSFADLLTYFISLVGSFLGTLLLNWIKSKFPNAFKPVLKRKIRDEPNQVKGKDA